VGAEELGCLTFVDLIHFFPQLHGCMGIVAGPGGQLDAVAVSLDSDSRLLGKVRAMSATGANTVIAVPARMEPSFRPASVAMARDMRSRPCPKRA